MAGNSTLCMSGAVPIALSQLSNCNHGFHCPNNNDTYPPQYCAPTKQCQTIRLQAAENRCDLPQGVYEPIVCEKGHYCPSPGSLQLLCPSKHFCPSGTETPFKCSRLSVCPAGSTREFPLEGFLVALVLDILLFALILAPSRLTARIRRSTIVSEEDASSEINVIREKVKESKISSDNLTRIATASAGFSLQYEDLGFEIQGTQKPIVASIAGQIKKGTLCGILGPSGAGKTTFMRLLMGKIQPTDGVVRVNGVPSALSRYKRIIGYVPSDDALLSELTVRENILHSCRIRGPRSWSDEDCHIMTENIMARLGILHIGSRQVGDALSSLISTGQRKRVSIAVELVAAPMALFLDEPTSGLDSTTAMSLTRLLKEISESGVTVVCIIHQPREKIFNSLDDVMILAEGRQLYHGPPEQALNYFNGHGYESSSDSANPADVLLDIAACKSQSTSTYIGTVDPVQRLAQMWEQQHCIQLEASRPYTSASEDLTALRPTPVDLSSVAATRGASWLRQVHLCFVRALKQNVRQPTSLLLEIAVGGVAGLLIGLGLYTNRGMHFQGVYLPPFELLSSAVDYSTVPKIGQMIALAIALAAAAPGVSTFGEEKPLYWREAAAGHRRSAYYVGKVLATLPRMALSALHFTDFYVILSTPIMPFWIHYVLNFLYFYCVYGLASFVSVAVRRENGNLLAMILCLIIGAFGGYAPLLSMIQQWHLEWLWRMCPGTWLTEAYFDQTLSKMAYLYDVHAAAAWTGFRLGRTPLDIGMIFIIGTFYRALAFAGLIWFDRHKQR